MELQARANLEYQFTRKSSVTSLQQAKVMG